MLILFWLFIGESANAFTTHSARKVRFSTHPLKNGKKNVPMCFCSAHLTRPLSSTSTISQWTHSSHRHTRTHANCSLYSVHVLDRNLASPAGHRRHVRRRSNQNITGKPATAALQPSPALLSTLNKNYHSPHSHEIQMKLVITNNRTTLSKLWSEHDLQYHLRGRQLRLFIQLWSVLLRYVPGKVLKRNQTYSAESE